MFDLRNILRKADFLFATIKRICAVLVNVQHLFCYKFIDDKSFYMYFLNPHFQDHIHLLSTGLALDLVANPVEACYIIL